MYTINSVTELFRCVQLTVCPAQSSITVISLIALYAYNSLIAELQICQTPQSSHGLENLEGSIFAWLVGCLFVCHGQNSFDVTLAFEDAH